MDQSQKRYAMQRVKDVLNAKQVELKKKFVVTQKEVTAEQKRDAVYNSDVELKKNFKLTDTVEGAYDFRRLKPANEFDDKGFSLANILLRETASKVMDEIMLGDSTKALKLIQEFCGS